MAWSDTDDDRAFQISDDQLYRRPSDTDSQVSDKASTTGERQIEDQPVKRPEAPAAPAVQRSNETSVGNNAGIETALNPGQKYGCSTSTERTI